MYTKGSFFFTDLLLYYFSYLRKYFTEAHQLLLDIFYPSMLQFHKNASIIKLLIKKDYSAYN